LGSQIATGVDACMLIKCGREVAVAASKSFTAQITSLLLLSIWIY